MEQTSSVNDKLQPVALVGKLSKECYSSAQEFAEELVQRIQIPVDTQAVIKGAKGDKGDRGEKGNKGDAGPAGTGITRIVNSVNIPNTATYVEFDIFTDWQYAIYQVRYNGKVSDPITATAYDDEVVVGVGTVVPVHAVPTPTKLRCYFVFKGPTDEVPDANHVLQITRFQ